MQDFPIDPRADLFEVDAQRELDASLRRVATGLAMIYWSVVIVFFLMIGMFVLGLSAAGQPDKMVRFMALFTWLFLAVEVLAVVGKLYCLATPEETGARSFIVGSIIFMLTGTALQVAGWFQVTLPEILTRVNVPSQIVSTVLFLLFLRAIARFLGAARLAKKASRLLIASAITILLGVTCVLMALQGGAPQWLQRPGGTMISVFLFLVLLIVGFYAFITYLGVLRDLRKTILGTIPPI